MTDYCASTDVAELLGRDLTVTELNQFPLLLQFASVKINRQIGVSANLATVPDAVNATAIDMLVRAFRQNQANPTGADITVGPVRIAAASVWLTAENKADLATVRTGPPKGIGTIGTYRGDVRSPYADRPGHVDEAWWV